LDELDSQARLTDTSSAQNDDLIILRHVVCALEFGSKGFL
jgi:hypothetical protein